MLLSGFRCAHPASTDAALRLGGVRSDRDDEFGAESDGDPLQYRDRRHCPAGLEPGRSLRRDDQAQARVPSRRDELEESREQRPVRQVILGRIRVWRCMTVTW
jgi:hypothetical protein